MIQANDLRLNNLVKRGNKGPWREEFNGEIVKLDIDNFNWLHRTPDWFEPIPLSPEILGKAGFKKSLVEKGQPMEGYYYSMELHTNRYCDLSLISGDKNGITEVCLFPYEDYFRVQYVHQLQNLVHALTQTELNINL